MILKQTINHRSKLHNNEWAPYHTYPKSIDTVVSPMWSTRTSCIWTTPILCFWFGTISKGWPICANVVWTGLAGGLGLLWTGLDLAFGVPNWMVILVKWLLCLSRDSPNDETDESSGLARLCLSVGAGSRTLRWASVGFISIRTLSALGISKYWSPGAEGAQGLKGSREIKLSGLKDKQMRSELQGQ